MGAGPESPPPPSDPVIRPARVEVLPPAGPPPAGRAQPSALPWRPRWELAAALFGVTALTTTTLGAVVLVATRTDASIGAFPWLTPQTVLTVWSDPALLGLGIRFSLPVLFILLCHELGHYLAARHHRLPATPPYFLPVPIGIGTFGAFIRIRAPIRGRRQLFDVGVAGPLAGFVALVPFLLWGVALSRPVPLPDPAPLELATARLWVPGHCLALDLATRLFHGPQPAGTGLDFHPFALAAWFGLLATAINLIPLGQLDGGHLLYAVTGRLHRTLAVPLWAGLAIAGLVWSGWLLWCLIVLVMGLRHPPVQDERTPLGPGRLALAVLALALFVLAFMPVPLIEVPLG